MHCRFTKIIKRKRGYFQKLRGVFTLKELQRLKIQSILYCLLGFLAALTLYILQIFFTDAAWLLIMLSILCAFWGIFFSVMLFSINIAQKNYCQLTCRCGTQLVYDENTYWQEISRWWAQIKAPNIERLYLEIQFCCKCPRCGTTKHFTVLLTSGKLNVGNSIDKDDIVCVESVVFDYFHGVIYN